MALTAALVLALSRPFIETVTPSFTSVVVVDLGPGTSASAVSDASRFIRELGSDVRVVAYSNRAERIGDPARLGRREDLDRLRLRLASPSAPDDPKAGGAALAAALQLAGAQVPHDGHGRITLYSNGLSNRDSAEAEAYRLAQRGIAIDVKSSDVATVNAAPILIQQVSIPSSARIGQTVDADVFFESKVTTDATVMVDANQHQMTSPIVHVKPGTNTVRMNFPLRSEGLTEVKVGVSTVGKIGPTISPSFLAATHVAGPIRIVMIRKESESGTAIAMTRLLGNSADILPVTPGDLNALTLEQADCVVLADVPAGALSPDIQARIVKSVSSGVGLFMTGTSDSFGSGGYTNSAISSILPVRMPQQADDVDPDTTLVVIIDTSGSMADSGRIDLAKEVARLAISHLTPHDKIGIVEFYGGRRWAAPIQSAGNTSVIGRALSRLTAGGGTTLYPAVEEAAFALRNVFTKTKHVLILSDGGIENAPFAPLLRQMAEDGVSVSAVAVSPDGKPNMMPDLARWGGGRFYSVPDRFALPDISLKQPETELLSSRVRATTPLVSMKDPALKTEANDAWPSVESYVRTVAKPTAEVLLRSASGDPILARWRYGSGFVATFPAELNSRATQSLQNDPAFATLFASLFRQIARHSSGSLVLDTVVRPGGIEINLTAANVAQDCRNAVVMIKLVDAGGEVVRATRAEAIRDGNWNVFLPAVLSGIYTVEATLGNQTNLVRAGVAVPAPRDIPRLFPDNELLKRIGDFKNEAARHAAALPNGISVFFDCAGYFVVGAIVLLVLHVAVRRWPASRKQTL